MPVTRQSFEKAFSIGTQHERLAGLALLPIICTLGFYLLPNPWQQSLPLQFLPQLVSFVGMGVWIFHNRSIPAKLGLGPGRLRQGLKYGLLIGLVLGFLNAWTILNLVPILGGDYTFLRHTPHAQVPFVIMVPWFIIGIAFLVELNFRGFILGRLTWIVDQLFPHDAARSPHWGNIRILLPVSLSAATFAFDPFLVTTFKHLHWIALWDGLVWGWVRTQLDNLYAVIIAHAMEVLILYLLVRHALT